MADINEINDLVANGLFKEARELIEGQLKEDANNFELMKLAGLIYVNLELWSSAKIYFEKVVANDAEDATSWFYFAKCCEKLSQFSESVVAYNTVIRLRPQHLDAYKNLCVLLMKIGDMQEAINYAKRAKDMSEEYIFSFIIGTALMKEKDFSEAATYLKEALSIEPNNLGTLNSLGTCYMALGEFKEAIETYEKALEIDPKAPMAYFNIGSAYQIKQEHEKAITYFKKALEIDDDESFLSALAISLIKTDKFQEALGIYKQLATMCPSKENYKYNVVLCYEALGEINTAIKMLEEIVYVNSKHILAAQKLASLYIKTNQLIKAKELYDNILLKNKITAEIMHQYAILSSSLCDSDTAEKMLKKVIKMNPNFAKAHKDLGIIFLNKRLFDYAEEEFETALKLAPNDFEILFEYGNYFYSISKNIEAEKYYLEALEIEPENVLALTFMALNKLVLNKLNEAHEYIMKAIKIEPHHEYVQFCVGRILYAEGKYDDAKPYLIRAVEQNPDIETQNTLALTYFKLGNYDQALNIFKNIDQKRPKNISVLMEIAKCYEALQDNDSALTYLDQVVSIFPENEEAHELIRKLS